MLKKAALFLFAIMNSNFKESYWNKNKFKLRRSIRRKHTLPNYKCRFKPFFDPLSDQKLYKSHIDEILLKNAANTASNTSEPATNPASSNPTQATDPVLPTSSTSGDSATEVMANKPGISNIQYRQLCEKIGFDLTSVGQLVIHLKFCDRLPESLYSLNLPQLSNQTSQPSIAGMSC